ncbi:MAG: amidase [Gemmatimonadales bacterium]
MHPLSRREALARLAALVATAVPHRRAWQSIVSRRLASDPLDGTIVEYLAGLRIGSWSVAEVTGNALDRCQTDGAKWRAIDVLISTQALSDARDSDYRHQRAHRFSALDGVPVFAKAIYDLKGTPTTGSNADWARLFPDPVPRDALEVERLRHSGAIVLGKTAADDFAYRGNGTSTYTGQVLNPHDPTGTRTPGGSSAGSAVAVAGGLAFGALGTDDGGSNRIPAQFTGVVGIKPTFGLVPRTGVIPTWPYLDTHGALARTVADAATLLAITAGPDGSDPLALGERWDRNRLLGLHDDALHGVRLGIVDAHVPRAQMTAEAVAMWDRAVGDLRAAGAEVDSFDAAITTLNYRAAFTQAARDRNDVKPDSRSPAPTANALYRYFDRRMHDAHDGVRRGYDAYRSYYDVLPTTFEECVPLLEQPMEKDPAGQSFAKSRAAVIAQLAASMQKAGVTAMVYPTMPFNAPRIVDQWPDIRVALGYGNWLGLPEVSVPAGMGADGMPAMNLSVVGLPGDDAKVLAYGHAYERQSRRFMGVRRGG